MAIDYSVGFEPADRLAQDRDSVRRRFWFKLKKVAAKLPFVEDLLGPITAPSTGRRPVTSR